MRDKISCSTCFKEFEFYRSVRKDAKYCSRKCQHIGLSGQRVNLFWSLASFDQKMNRLKKSFDRWVIRTDGCWKWSRSSYGNYPTIRWDNKNLGVHRASWLIHYGEIPDNLFVCHACDNRECSNPKHLFLGNAKDNTQDMLMKKRGNKPKGEDHISSKLKEEEIIYIRSLLSLGVPCSKIAKQYNVHYMTIADIKYKRTWKHI